jgi:PTS system nitrogen regulatory IIA component
MKLTVQYIARVFAVSEKTVYRWINQGEIPAYKINDQYRFNRTEIIEWANNKRINFSHELIEEPESEGDAFDGLAASLMAGGIFYRLCGKSKEEVLNELVKIIRIPENVDSQFLYRVLLARENLGSTAIGEGIAVPHARMPVVLHVSKPSVSLCFMDEPIEFGALDGLPVFALFTIISPTIRAHLNLLSRLSYVLRDDSFKAILRKQGNRNEILDKIRIIESEIKTSASS